MRSTPEQEDLQTAPEGPTPSDRPISRAPPFWDVTTQVEIVEDTPGCFRLRFQPQWRAGAKVRWEIVTAGLLLVSFLAPLQTLTGEVPITEWRFLLPFLGLLWWMDVSEYVWMERGWEEVTITPEGVRVRSRRFRAREGRWFRLDRVRRFKVRPLVMLRFRGDLRSLTLVHGVGRRFHFGPGVAPGPLVALLNSRLDGIRRARPLLP